MLILVDIINILPPIHANGMTHYEWHEFYCGIDKVREERDKSKIKVVLVECKVHIISKREGEKNKK